MYCACWYDLDPIQGQGHVAFELPKISKAVHACWWRWPSAPFWCFLVIFTRCIRTEYKLQVNPGAKLLLKWAQECYLSSWMRELKQDVWDPSSHWILTLSRAVLFEGCGFVFEAKFFCVFQMCAQPANARVLKESHFIKIVKKDLAVNCRLVFV